jgi:hypothetical protein
MGMATTTALESSDVRFPTSELLDGSDAVNVDPDDSAAYVILRTDAPDGLAGHGFASKREGLPLWQLLARMSPESLRRHAFPGGAVWSEKMART